MNCRKCGNENCSIINEVSTSGKDFYASNACCGSILFGPIGVLCGACGGGKNTHNTAYWVCNSCGNKFKA